MSTPEVRLKEAMTGIIMDFCAQDGQSLRQWAPHAYITQELPEGNHQP